MIVDPSYIPHVPVKPLMKNWTEDEAERRCQYDYVNGKALVPGKVMVLILIILVVYYYTPHIFWSHFCFSYNVCSLS